MANHRYMVILRNTPGAGPGGKPTPEQMAAMQASFGAWRERWGDRIVDLGGRLAPTGRVMRESAVTDGPFAEAKEVIGGFMIVAAPDYDGALEIARGCPGVVRPGNSIEVREIASS